MNHSERPYLPAAGRDAFLRFYDLITKVLGVDRARVALLAQAHLQPGHQVLDVGCGTGTLAVLIKQRYPAIEVVGIDPDPKALARAQRKADRAGLSIHFDRGFADSLTYPDRTFDRVFSSMMFHHIEPGQKEATLREIRRVLKPGGRLEFLDIAAGHAHTHGLARLIHSDRQLADNVEDRILGLMAGAGFAETRKLGQQRTIFGDIAFYQASAPATA